MTSVSVIVIAFNAEMYIRRCLDSILRQTFQDFELILIDDGSTDTTEAIFEEYRKLDSRIRCFHDVNHGIAISRQRGIDMATGEYSIFVDADDWIEPKMLNCLYNRAKETNADIVICDFWEEYGEHSAYRKQDPGTNDHLVIQRKMLNELHASMWNKLIRHQLYRHYDLRFLSGLNCCEDQFLMVRLFSHPVNVSYEGTAFYHYDKSQNNNSITNQWLSRPLKERLLFLEQVEPYMEISVEHRTAFDYYAGKRVYDATFAGKEEEEEFRKMYVRYKKQLKRSPLPFGKKIFCHLRYLKLGWINSSFRYIRNKLTYI